MACLGATVRRKGVSMEISYRELITVLHGMGFGALFMLAFSGAIGVIYATAVAGGRWPSSSPHIRMFRFYLISMSALVTRKPLSAISACSALK